MKLTAQIKLLPSEIQQASLHRTLEHANAACNFLSALAWQEQLFSRYQLQARGYYEVRERFDLSVQMTLQCIVKVASAYNGAHTGPPTFRPRGAIGYDDRILSWNMAARTVSIWTVDGRQTIPFVAGKQALELLNQRRGESDLCLVDGRFYLYATCEADAAEPQVVTSYLGVDLGIANVAVDPCGDEP